MAIVLPLLLLIVFGIIEFGIGFNRQLRVTEAAHEGARLAALYGDEGTVRAKVTEMLGADENAGLTVDPQVCDVDSAGGYATVDVSLYYWSPTGLGALMSHFGGRNITSFTIQATGTMPCVG